MMQEGGVILDIVLFVGICFVFGVFDLEIYFWCVVGCYSSTSRKSTVNRVATKLTSFYFALHTRSIFYQRKCKCLFQQAVGELDK